MLPWALLSAARLRRVAGLRECSGCHRDVLRVLAAHRHTSGVGAGEVAVETPIWAVMWALVWVPKWVLLCAALLRRPLLLPVTAPLLQPLLTVADRRPAPACSRCCDF